MKLSRVTVKVTSLIENIDTEASAPADFERAETLSEGRFIIHDDGRAIVSYSEQSEGGSVKTEISVFGSSVTVSRRGAIESEMRFEEGRAHSSVYSIPPYRFDAEIFCDCLTAEIYPERARIELAYKMKIGGAERRARMKIWILPNSSQG